MTRLCKSLSLVGLSLLVFALARLGLYLSHRPDFADLSAGEVAVSFLRGLRFDLSITLAFLFLPLAMMNLPLRFAKREGWLRLWGALGFLPVVVFVFVIGGDLSYYDYVHRHVANELWLMAQDLGYLLESALVEFWYGLLGALVFLGGLAWLWSRILRKPTVEARFAWVRFAVLLAAMALGIRGTVSGKALNSLDAFAGQGYAAGNLALNGVYTTFRSRIRDDVDMDEVPLDLDDAYAELGLDRGAEYPALVEHPGRQPTRRNFVWVLMESWDTRYCDSYREEPLGLTPNFDRIASEGVLFRNFYSASQRSIGALQAVLLGMPCVPGLPELGYGLELNNVPRLGEIAARQGYRSLLIQAPKRRSYYVDAIAKSLGFDSYYGMEDMPLLRDYGGETATFGWDHETYQFAIGRIDEFEAPFVALIFTGSIHSPYPDPGEEFHARPHVRKGEDGYMNLLKYSDWALGQFVEEARKRPWFKDTVFVFCADHPWRTTTSKDLRDSFRIPCMMFGPGVEPGSSDVVASQSDGLPTIMDALGFDDAYAALGESLLRKREGPVMVKKGVVVGMISDRGFVQHSLRERVDTGDFGEDPGAAHYDALERRLLAICRVTHDLVTRNRWFR